MNIKQKALHSIGGKLRHLGTLLQRESLNVKIIEIINAERLRTFLKTLGYDNVTLSDKQYYLTDWDTWKTIIKDDQTNLYRYLTDRTDCDNFADYFNSSASIIYGLNTSGRFSVELSAPDTDNHIGWHRASVIVCMEEGKLSLYAYDPMYRKDDCFVKITDEDNVVMGDWDYQGWFLSFC